MTDKSDIQHVIDELIRDVQSDCADVTGHLLNELEKNKASHVNAVLNSLARLKRIVRDNRRPGWIDAIAAAAKGYLASVESDDHAKDDHATALSNVIRENWNNIASFTYQPNPTVEVPDFQSFYRKQFLDLKIREKFDGLANQLQALIETEQIENAHAIRRLEELINLLRKNRNGNLVEVTGTHAAAVAFKHLWINTLKETPGIKILVKAAEDSIDELGLDVGALFKNTLEDIANCVGIDPKYLGITPPPRPALPAPSDKPIDAEYSVIHNLPAPSNENGTFDPAQ